jgi:multimeric flavodoxin WrbA
MTSQPCVYPGMTAHRGASARWPLIWERVKVGDTLVIAGPNWRGEHSSLARQIVERLYAHLGQLKEQGQLPLRGRVGGALITGNQDCLRHCPADIVYSLQHLGYVISPQADAGWIGDIGPGPSYLDEGPGPTERLQSQHDLCDVESDASRADDPAGGGCNPANGNQRSPGTNGSVSALQRPTRTIAELRPLNCAR